MSTHIKEPTLDDLIIFKKRLHGWGVALIVVGIVGIVACLALTIYFGIMQTVGLRKSNVLPFFITIAGVALFSCVVSAGVYMFKTAKMITLRLNENKKYKEVNNEEE